MATHAAFLRGINLGNRRVSNDRLAALFHGMGFEGATPYRASGNVALDLSGLQAEDARERIERGLEEGLGYPVATFLRSLARLEELAESEALADLDEGVNVHVTFLRNAPGPSVRESLDALETPDDRFRVDGREVLWFRRGRMTDSEIGHGDLAGALGTDDTTMRNMNTVRRIVRKFA